MFQKYFLTPKVGEGAEGRVYAISDDHVVKIAKHLSGYDPQREFKMMLALYKKGIPVPKPEGVFDAYIRELGNTGSYTFTQRGLIMERIEGKPLSILYVREDLHKQKDEMLCNFRNMGISPHDPNNCNVLYNTKTKSLTFIDVGYWRIE